MSAVPMELFITFLIRVMNTQGRSLALGSHDPPAENMVVELSWFFLQTQPRASVDLSGGALLRYLLAYACFLQVSNEGMLWDVFVDEEVVDSGLDWGTPPHYSPALG